MTLHLGARFNTSRNRACGAPPEDLIDFQHSAEAVAQLLKRKGFTVVKLFANRLYDSSFDKAAVLGRRSCKWMSAEQLCLRMLGI